MLVRVCQSCLCDVLVIYCGGVRFVLCVCLVMSLCVLLCAVLFDVVWCVCFCYVVAFEFVF